MKTFTDLAQATQTLLAGYSGNPATTTMRFVDARGEGFWNYTFRSETRKRSDLETLTIIEKHVGEEETREQIYVLRGRGVFWIDGHPPVENPPWSLEDTYERLIQMAKVETEDSCEPCEGLK